MSALDSSHDAESSVTPEARDRTLNEVILWLAIVSWVVGLVAAVAWVVGQSGADAWSALLFAFAAGCTSILAYRLGSSALHQIDAISLLERRALRAREDTTSDPWGAVNHSDPVVHWDDVDRETQLRVESAVEAVRRAEVSSLRRAIAAPRRIWRLAEDCSTENFKVEFGDPWPATKSIGDRYALLLRVYRTTDAEARATRNAAVDLVVRANVFRKPRGIAPLTKEVLVQWSRGRRVAQFYEFREEDRHFFANDGFVKDFARSLGTVQHALRAMQKPTTWLIVSCELRRRWAHVLGAAQGTPAISVAPNGQHHDLVQSWLQTLDTRDKYYPICRAYPSAIFDTHVHNTFGAEGSQCSLIYDYEQVAACPQDITAAFSMHRIVREVVRNEQFVDAAARGARLSDLCEAFRAAYLEGLGDEADPGALWLRNVPGAPNVGDVVAWANMQKLVGVGEKVVGLREDPAQRDRARLEAELRKFVMFMAEARELQSACAGRQVTNENHVSQGSNAPSLACRSLEVSELAGSQVMVSEPDDDDSG